MHGVLIRQAYPCKHSWHGRILQEKEEARSIMAKGYALTVGLNSVDPNHYAGWSGNLVACEADARDMATVLTARGFQVTTLLTRRATRDAVLKSVSDAAKSAKSGDIFVYTNSSHGGQLPDKEGDEEDGLDETICMYDGQIIDDELYAILGGFAAGVRVLLLSDSCHSGTMARPMPGAAPSLPGADGIRGMPLEVQSRTYYAHQSMYDKLLRDPAHKHARDATKASILLISGCMDNQTSADGAFNGLFTGTLLRVWNGGKFKGSYKKFWKKITSLMPKDQSPNFYWATTRDAEFERQTPFSI
jgi:metacaspase-1